MRDYLIAKNKFGFNSQNVRDVQLLRYDHGHVICVQVASRSKARGSGLKLQRDHFIKAQATHFIKTQVTHFIKDSNCSAITLQFIKAQASREEELEDTRRSCLARAARKKNTLRTNGHEQLNTSIKENALWAFSYRDNNRASDSMSMKLSIRLT